VDYSDGTKWDGLGFKNAEAGAFVGYNWQISRSWVVGLELDGTWLGLSNTDFDGTHNASINWMASITGRAGYLVGPHTLLYGKLGWAMIGLDIPGASYVAPGTGSKDLNAIQGGIGIETALAPHWKARVEGLYTAALQGYSAFDAGSGLGFNLKPELVSARFGIVYSLGAGDGRPLPYAAPKGVAKWTGLYAGGQVGAAISDTREEYFHGPVSGVSWDGFGARNANGGGFVGVNHQIGKAVFGVEVNGTWLAQLNHDTFLDLTWGKLNWMAALDARGGFLVGPTTLLYGKVGWARMGFESTYPNYPVGPESSKVLNGLQGGIGIETQVSVAWSLRVEGLYTKALDGLEFGLPAQGHSFKPDMVSAEAGIAYHF
jgi:hypothetical protein